MIRRTLDYWRRHGTSALVERAAHVLLDATSVPVQATVDTETLVRRQFLSCSRLPYRRIPRSRPRLTMVTDTINPPHLYGGVGTAMILSVLLAERLGRDLRIVTRFAVPEGKHFAHIMEVAGLRSSVAVEFAFAAYGSEAPRLDTSDDEIFLTTSWWTTRGTRDSIAPARIVYLLQEDERMFYPYGDEQLRCAETLLDPEITFVINTELLFDHLVRSGLENVAANGTWFEPSFPEAMFHPGAPPAPGSRRRFLFYARPNNVRNLFYRGVEAIEGAIAGGALPPAEWEICLVGKDIPRLQFSGGVEPSLYENLTWQSYAALVRRIDLGLCLMYTPHPSYPPLDLAASGAVVVTNRFAGKAGLARYSDNIICADPSVQDLVRGIAQGARLAQDGAARRANYAGQRILRDWRQSFAATLEALSRRLAA